MTSSTNLVIYLFGTAGCGKTTVMNELFAKLTQESAERCCYRVEGDDFHPIENKNKMANGTPLNDEDRYPWLRSINGHVMSLLTSNEKQGDKVVIVACSALKQKYRMLLADGLNQIPDCKVFFVHLHTVFSVIEERLSKRTDHFMKASMLLSQFQTLEMPNSEELSDTNTLGYQIVVCDMSVYTTVADIVTFIVQRIVSKFL